ncbi:MAG: glycerophosphodiester phosphodiesterase [Bacilli bacterium]|nr:glycerophosphodiester phosphodiesterase [Bacilli bacterium]MDD4076676.1 glycerophosphodiester phosphodiesterase [Bacilli bacterium]MDD4388838.1 glycerophosphodiester phosphodiesterase [Bacilli bacterium]
MKFSRQMVVAHRGASGLVKHENTIEAFQKAIEIGADCIECDVRKTADGVIIIYHDELINGVVVNSLKYQEILDINGFHVPTLEETLKFVKGKILIDIELKEGGYEEEAIFLIQKHLTNDEFYIRSFLDETLKKVKKIDKTIITALLLGLDKPKNVFLTRLSELFPFFRILKTKCNFVSPYYKLLRLGFVTRMKLIGKPVSVWTVDDELLMVKLLKKKKIDSIVTNYPDVALRVLGRTDKTKKSN